LLLKDVHRPETESGAFAAKPDCQNDAAIRQLGLMRIIPVIDLMDGRAVRAIAGRRSEYRPIGEPTAVARRYRDSFGFETAYVADLDAIMHGRADVPSWKLVAAAGLGLWLDAGVRSPQTAKSVIDELQSFSNRFMVIAGLESLDTLDCLSEVAAIAGRARLAFSLDLKHGQPVTTLNTREPSEIAHRVAAMGIERMIVLDLADVGVAQGTRTLELCSTIRQQFPEIELIAGGGVRGLDDLRALWDAGCDAALVASALHDGRLTPDDVRRVERWQR
jgi:phosphoribosylformimino-5-aminoimidazole carboxamide ribotide isomerase